MKTRSSIITASLTGAGLLAAAVFTSVQQNSLAASPPVDPAHAAHVAAGSMPPDAPAGDPALTQQLAELQAKVTQLQASLAKGAPPAAAAAMPGMAAATPPAAPAPAPPMAMGMGKMKPGGMPGMKAGAAPAPPMAGMSGSPGPAAGGMGMMGMMDKMMGMMDKMMGMGGGAAMPPAAPMAGAPPMAMDMDDKMEMPPMGGAMPPAAPASAMSPGMGMDAMEMAGMMGMSPMGGGSPAAMTQSALPGFPGASHLYHIGATGFFLDHPQHITLTMEQQAALNQAKQTATFVKSTADRAVEQVEQELWMLTAADQPDATQIEAKIRETEKLRGDERLAFIRAVGEASALLTDGQRKSLAGYAPPAPAAPMPMPAPAAAPMAAPGAPMPAGGMPDM